ncbi:hypothetical protein PVAG01_05735 [Phlyctema vagabunda]|uniref:DUF3074 domain-containing protein n=1 Tax=Phlyctema vagabunda TaxID=108571 RepID=A0ABR4PKY8_9HELO
MSSSLGPLVRLEGITVAQLPLGGKGVEPSNRASNEKFSDGSGSTAALSLKTFIFNILNEAIPFIDGVAPKDGSSATWKSKGAPKSFASSEAPVHLYEKVVAGKDLDKVEGMNQFTADRKNETWFCRRSCHKNKTAPGTASWDEFIHSFKEHHAETEDAFTPSVIGNREAIRWNTTGIEAEIAGEHWANITLILEEMKHQIDPKPLRNRVFPVIQLAAELVGSKEFLVVSIPVMDFEKSPYADFSRDKSLVVAAYASIERIREIPSNGDIEWIMATASNAGGILPQWIQNLAVPAAVAKDVEMFMSWIPSQRLTIVKSEDTETSGA